jgi:hypothetical protein
MRRLEAPTRRWQECRLGDPTGVAKAERNRLKDAARIVDESPRISPELVADVIATVC